MASEFAAGRPISIRLIAVCNSDGVDEERAWIGHYRRLGADLTNSTEGGRGGLNPSEETRRKMSAAQRARPPATPETRALISKRVRESYTEARRRRVAEYSRNRPAEVLARISRASRNRTPEHIKKHAEAMRRKWADPAFKAAMRVKQLARWARKRREHAQDHTILLAGAAH